MPSGGADAFEEALMAAMLEPVGAGEASSILPYVARGAPARDVLTEVLWDGFVNGG